MKLRLEIGNVYRKAIVFNSVNHCRFPFNRIFSIITQYFPFSNIILKKSSFSTKRTKVHKILEIMLQEVFYER
jgi:hypothetical protein